MIQMYHHTFNLRQNTSNVKGSETQLKDFEKFLKND